MKIAVINIINKEKKQAINKDLNGGFGTADSYANSWPEKLIGLIKKKSVKLPIISLAFLMGIFKQRNISAEYYEGRLPETEPDIILIYGSIVDYKNENTVAKQLKEKFPRARIGFIGPFPSTKPELFNTTDFIIKGDFEYFFLKKFNQPEQLNGQITVANKINLAELPLPAVENFPIENYNYYPSLAKKPFFALQSSRGCPYSCAYYCIYGRIQGSQINVRPPAKVIEDIFYLSNGYGVKSFQFRDPTFGLMPGWVEEFCRLLKEKKLKIQWGMETRVDLLTEEKIKIMFDAGLRVINLGLETVNPAVAQQNKRLLANQAKQEELIGYCEKLGVKIAAFYLFGYPGETKESLMATLNYAKKLNTFMARFAVCTPYPGTEFFADLEKQGRILTDDYEQYTQFNPVMKHDNLTNEDIRQMLSRAYQEYYFRPSYILNFIIWKIREFWL